MQNDGFASIMESSHTTLRTLLLMGGFFSSILKLLGGEPAKPPYQVADIYREMREAVLKLKPADQGETDNSKILAVVMDTGFPEGAFTVIATVDGSASLYLSNGGGTIGAGGHQEGAKAAKALIAEASKHVSKMAATKEAPMVQPEMTAFYFVTGKGLVTAMAKENELGEGHHELSPLFHKAHELITAIRAIDEPNRKKP